VIEETVRVRDLLEVLGFKVRIGELAIKVLNPSVLIATHTGDRREFPIIIHGLAWRESGAPRVDQGVRNDHKAQVGQAKGVITIPPNSNGPQPS
jgi:hypothetical protein